MNPATDTATLVHQSLQRLASQSAACKLWSTALVTGVLAWMHSSRIGNDSMLWAASPVLVLLLADAAYATQAARLLAKLRQSKKPGVEDLLQAHAPLSGGHTLGGLAGLVSSSVWPFYFALACAFFIAGHEAARPALPPPSAPGSSSLNRLGSANPGALRPAGPTAPLKSAPIPGQPRPLPNGALSPTGSARPKAPVNITTPRPSNLPASAPNSTLGAPERPSSPVPSSKQPPAATPSSTSPSSTSAPVPAAK